MEVIHWLASQEWPEPKNVQINDDQSTGVADNVCSATVAMGRDHYLDIFMPAEVLDLLKEYIQEKELDSQGSPAVTYTCCRNGQGYEYEFDDVATALQVAQYDLEHNQAYSQRIEKDGKVISSRKLWNNYGPIP